jgi:hypothetical protein
MSGGQATAGRSMFASLGSLSVEALAMVQSFALATLAFQAHPPLAGIFALVFTSGLLITFDNPARRSFVAELVPETEVQNAVSLSTALMTSARVVGPALGGILIATSGFGWCFALDGLSYVAVLLALLLGSTPIGGPAIGVVCDAFGARAGLGVGAVAALGAGLWGGLMRRQLSRNASPSADVAPAVLQPKP